MRDSLHLGAMRAATLEYNASLDGKHFGATERIIRAYLSAMSAGTVAQEAVKSVRIPYEKRPIAIKRSVDVESFYAASEQEQAAWNKYAQDEADKFNSNPSLDTYDSTNTYDWCPPRSFPEWIKEYRSALTSPQASEPAPQVHPDDLAVDRFAAVMKAKLAKKRDEGRSGWEDKDDCSQIFLSHLLREHVEKGDPVDVGNLAMMLHQREERILSLLETLQGE